MKSNRKIVYFLLVLIFCVSNFAMPQNNDSLLEKIEKTEDQTELISIYNKLGNSLRYAYPDSALQFYKKSLMVAQHEKNELMQAEALGSIGTVYALKFDYDSAYFFINECISKNTDIKNLEGVAKGLNSLGLINMKDEKMLAAKHNLRKAVTIGKQINDSVLLSKSYNNLGILFKRENNFDSSLFYFHESLKLKELLGDLKGIGSTTNNIALIYEKISEFDLALLYLEQSLKIRQLNKNRYGEALVLNNFGLVYESQGKYKEALEKYLLSLEVMTELNRTGRIATLCNNIGSVYIKLKDFKNGNAYLIKGLEINKKLKNYRGQMYSMLAMANFYEDLKIYQNAISKYYEALELAEIVNDVALTSEVYEGLFSAYELLDRFDSALYFYKQYTMLNDSVFNTYSKRNIEKLEIEYQNLKNEKENQDLVRQNQIKEEKMKRLLLVGIILILLLISIIVSGFFMVQSKQKIEKTYRLVLEQRNNIQTQSYELTNAYKKLKEFSNVKEELTSMIVHDLKNPLNIILNVSTINNYPDKDHVIQQSGKQMHNLVMNILDVYKYEGKSVLLERENMYINPLIYKVKTDMSFVVSEKSLKIKLEMDYDFKLEIDKSAFERIIVNLLTNAIKFSTQGSTIFIKTEAVKDNKFRLHIIDQGSGIPAKNISQIFEKFEQHEIRKLGYSGSTGIGLTYCKMAVEAHGGIIGVVSEVGKGSDFYVEMAYNETKISEIVEADGDENYLLLSKDNRRTLYPHIAELQEHDIFEVSEIRNILKGINREHKEIREFCNLIESSVLNCNQQMFDDLLELALSKE